MLGIIHLVGERTAPWGVVAVLQGSGNGPIDFQFRNPEYRELLLSGLRLAAGEET